MFGIELQIIFWGILQHDIQLVGKTSLVTEDEEYSGGRVLLQATGLPWPTWAEGTETDV